jgi:hypothetical protein
MTAKTSGDSTPGVSHDIFRRIQDSFTTQDSGDSGPKRPHFATEVLLTAA